METDYDSPPRALWRTKPSRQHHLRVYGKKARKVIATERDDRHSSSPGGQEASTSKLPALARREGLPRPLVLPTGSPGIDELARQQQENLETTSITSRKNASDKATSFGFAQATNLAVHQAATPIGSASLRPRPILSDKSNFATKPMTKTTTMDSPRLTQLPPSLTPRLTRFHSLRRAAGAGSNNDSPRNLLSTPTTLASALHLSVRPSELGPEPAHARDRAAASPKVAPLASRPPLGPRSSPAPAAARTSTSVPTSRHPGGPADPVAADTRPTFRFTTTEFDNSWPFSPDREDRAWIAVVAAHARKEGDGLGMESTFWLESWDPDSAEAELGVHDDILSQAHVLLGPLEIDRGDEIPVERSKDEVDEVGGAIVSGTAAGGDQTREDTRAIGRDLTEDDAGVRIERDREASFADESGSTVRGETSSEPGQANPAPGGEEGEEEAAVNQVFRHTKHRDRSESAGENQDDDAENSESLVQASLLEQLVEPTDDPTRRLAELDLSNAAETTPRRGRATYDASHLPPRRPRSPHYVSRSSSADRVGIPSDEDDLAYLIRTTLTHSSEDDLPLAARTGSERSSDEREFELAEREVGRGVKATSGQRRKRVEVRERKRRGGEYLRIGAGKGGRRLEWKREIVERAEAGDGSDEDDLAWTASSVEVT
ncbi:hypothetical protein JCM11491_002255 [Sporobolomyces phaffii]